MLSLIVETFLITHEKMVLKHMKTLKKFQLINMMYAHQVIYSIALISKKILSQLPFQGI